MDLTHAAGCRGGEIIASVAIASSRFDDSRFARAAAMRTTDSVRYSVPLSPLD